MHKVLRIVCTLEKQPITCGRGDFNFDFTTLEKGTEKCKT